MTDRARAGWVGVGITAAVLTGCSGSDSPSAIVSRAATATTVPPSATGTESASLPSTPAPATSAPATSAPATSAPVTSSPANSASPSGPTASASPPPTGAKAVLASVVLRRGDLPATWTAKPADPDTSTPAEQAELLDCVGGKNTDVDKTATIDSDDYSSGNYTVSSSADRYKSQADIAADIALLRRPLVTECFRADLRRELQTGAPSGSKVGTVSVKVTPGAGGGPANLAGMLNASIEFTVGAQKITVFEDLAFITGTRIEADVTFTGVGSRVPPAVQAQMIALVARRAAKA